MLLSTNIAFSTFNQLIDPSCNRKWKQRSRKKDTHWERRNFLLELFHNILGSPGVVNNELTSVTKKTSWDRYQSAPRSRLKESTSKVLQTFSEPFLGAFQKQIFRQHIFRTSSNGSRILWKTFSSFGRETGTWQNEEKYTLQYFYF